ncbi:MAG: hypothetical protein P8Y02_03735 [Deinococcales bacterium]
MTDPWMARKQAKEHHQDLVRQAGRERRLESAAAKAVERGFWARLFGLRRSVGAADRSTRSTPQATSVRSSPARLDVAEHDL